MPKKGEKYTCDECGLTVVVDEGCECTPACEIVCCEQPMKKVEDAGKTSKKQTK